MWLRRPSTKTVRIRPSIPVPSKSISALTYEKDPAQKFPFSPGLRQFHMQVLGRPGGGKTKFLEACMRQDIEKGHGMFLLDPAGNLYNDLVKWIIQKGYLRTRQVILINANHPTHTFAFNPLQIASVPGETARERLGRITHVVDATMLAIGSIQGGEDPDEKPRYNYVMRLILHAMAENNLTLCDSHLFTNYAYREQRRALYEKSLSAGHRESWRQLDQKKQSDFDMFMEAPVNRFARFSSPSLSCIVGQQASSFDFLDAMDQGAIVLVHAGLDPVGLTETDSKILGRLLLNNLTMRAKERYTRNKRKPREFYCYIDECDKFLNQDIATGIDKLRQFGLRMILSHQNIAQLDDAGDKVRGSVLGSTATKVFFALSDEDAELVVQRTYNGRISYDETIDALDKPVVVGHTIGHLRSSTKGEGKGKGTARTHATGSSRMESAGQALRGDPGFFGVGESEISHTLGEGSGSSSMESVAQSSMTTESVSQSITETLIPELAWLPTSRLTLEEQLYERKRRLVLMPPQHCVVSLPHAISFDAVVRNVNTPVVSDRDFIASHTRFYDQHPEKYRLKEAVYEALNQEINRNSLSSMCDEDDETVVFS